MQLKVVSNNVMNKDVSIALLKMNVTHVKEVL